ncbi:MAG: DinB family protein [Bacillota bacterium]
MDAKAIVLENLRTERRLTRETVVAMTDGDMDFRPTPEQMDFGTQALHILSAYSTLMEALSGKGWNWEQGMTRATCPTQAAILELYDAETARLLAFVEGLEPEEFYTVVQTGWGAKEAVLALFMGWMTHEAHHRGQMVTYLRLKGMTPAPY